MPNPMTLPLLMVLTVAGSGLGVYLGKSAIGEIDPVHYSSPQPGSRFHADLVPNRPEWDSASTAGLHNAALSRLGGGCVGCATYPEEYRPVRDEAIESYIATYAAYDPVPAGDIIEDVDREIAGIAARAAARAAASQSVTRYAYYPVSAEEAEVRVTYGGVTTEAAEPSPRSPNCCEPGNVCAGAPTPGI